MEDYCVMKRLLVCVLVGKIQTAVFGEKVNGGFEKLKLLTHFKEFFIGFKKICMMSSAEIFVCLAKIIFHLSRPLV